MKKILFALSLILVVFACSEDEEPVVKEAKGAIFATVKIQGQIVPLAQVTTEPVTISAETDLTGTVIISDVPVGGYKVNAFHPDIGSGSASVSVAGDAVVDVTINLIGGIFENPVVSILSPSNGSIFKLGDAVIFSANVSDSEDDPSELNRMEK